MRVIDINGGRRCVAIEFSPDEQDALLKICINVGGPQAGPRGAADKLAQILEASGAMVNPSHSVLRTMEIN